MTTALWQVLQAEHDRIWELLGRITGGPGEPSAPPKRQREWAEQLVAYQSAHEFAEETVLWPVLRRDCPDGAQLASVVRTQEHDVKLALHDLEGISAGTEEFDKCIHTVASLERKHLTYEQTQLWPRLTDALEPATLDALLTRWLVARRRTATRPHPHLPMHPAVLRAAVPVLAGVDRARDRMGRREPPAPAGG